MARRDSTHKDVSISYTYVAATDYSTANAKIAAVTGHTIFIKRILVCVTTDNAATQTFQDSSSTPIVVAHIKASPGIGALLFDFAGDDGRGFALTEGKSFDHKMSAAGQAGSVTVEAYIKRTATGSA